MKKEAFIVARYIMLFAVIWLIAFRVTLWILIPVMVITAAMFLYRYPG
ncbi:MAG: hypothetical protein V1837_03925 [Candidatus Woesearchaeota archaeon]